MASIFHKNQKVAWNGSSAFHDNGKIAWNGSSAFHANGRIAWNGSSAFHDDGKPAGNVGIEVTLGQDIRIQVGKSGFSLTVLGNKIA